MDVLFLQRKEIKKPINEPYSWHSINILYNLAIAKLEGKTEQWQSLQLVFGMRLEMLQEDQASHLQSFSFLAIL